MNHDNTTAYAELERIAEKIAEEDADIFRALAER